MHDIKLIRKSPEVFDRALEKRGESSKSIKIITPLTLISKIKNTNKEIRTISIFEVYFFWILSRIRMLVIQNNIATVVSCLPISWMYTKPFLPPDIPKLSNIENITKNIDANLKFLFVELNKW